MLLPNSPVKLTKTSIFYNFTNGPSQTAGREQTPHGTVFMGLTRQATNTSNKQQISHSAYPGSGPEIARSNTCRGFSQYFSFRKNRTPFRKKYRQFFLPCIFFLTPHSLLSLPPFVFLSSHTLFSPLFELT